MVAKKLQMMLLLRYSIHRRTISHLFSTIISLMIRRKNTEGDLLAIPLNKKEWDDNAKIVVTDMMFNMGLPRLKGFTKFLKAMELGDYETAANEMLDSLWAKQVKGRALELANMIRGTVQV